MLFFFLSLSKTTKQKTWGGDQRKCTLWILSYEHDMLDVINFRFMMKAKSCVVMSRNARWGCREPVNITVAMLLFWKWRSTCAVPPAESFTWLPLRSSRAPPKLAWQESVEEPSNVPVMMPKLSACAFRVESYWFYTVLWTLWQS